MKAEPVFVKAVPHAVAHSQVVPGRSRRCRKTKVLSLVILTFFTIVSAFFGMSHCFGRLEAEDKQDRMMVPNLQAQLLVNTTTGQWRIDVQGITWFRGDTGLSLLNGVTSNGAHECGPSRGDAGGCSLMPSGSRTYLGSDAIGAYTATELQWNVLSTTVLTRFRAYNDSKTFVFEQVFPSGVPNTGSRGRPDVDGVLLKFPAVDVFEAEGLSQGYVQYQGSMLGDAAHAGRWSSSSTGIGSGAENTGPLLVFDAASRITAVWSAASSFMAVNQVYNTSPPCLAYGILGSVTSIPPHFSSSIILSFDAGINNAVATWGSKLRSLYKKSRDYAKTDFGLNYLGYSTDNGAYYYYLTEDGKNYEDTLIDVQAATSHVGLPVRHILLDSWWYYKGVQGGVKTWEPMPSIFPHGLMYLYNKTRWPAVAHNRYWSSDTTYARQNGGDWDFYIDNSTGYAMPLQREFWEYLLSSNKQWGLMTYEQDWLYNEFMGVELALTDPTAARMWLMQMGDAAKRNGMTIQYCMAWSRHALQSLEIPVVTQARVSGDYHPGNEQWRIGLTSMIAHALALRPSKDNWWSSPLPSWKDLGQDRETKNRLQSLVAILSTGPYTPGDKIGFMDVDLIMRGAMTDGTLLQPDVPATAIDENILNKADPSFGGPSGEVWSTYTTIGSMTWHYVLAVGNTQPFALTPDMISNISNTFTAFEANATSFPRTFSPSAPLVIPTTDEWSFNFWTFAPAFSNGWTLLGENNKWIPVSNARFENIQEIGDTIEVTVRGAHTEQVALDFSRLSNDGTILEWSVKCQVGPSMTVKFIMPGNICVT